MPTPKQIARAAAGAFIGKLWGSRLQHDEHGEMLTETILGASKEILNEKASAVARAVVKGTEADSTFEAFWDLYAKKVGRHKCRLKWRRLSARTRQRILEHAPAFVEATPDAQYRPNPLTYLNGHCWLDEGLPTNGAAQELLTHAEAVTVFKKAGGGARELGGRTWNDLFTLIPNANGGHPMFQRKA